MRGHTHAFRRVGVVLIVLMLIAVPVAAQTAVTYDFESGTISSDFTTTDNFAINSTNPINGSFEVYATISGGTSLELDTGGNTVDNVTSKMKMHGDGQNQNPKIALRDGGNNQYALMYHRSGYWTVLNGTSDEVNMSVPFEEGVIYTVRIEPHYNGSSTYYVEGPNATTEKLITNFQTAQGGETSIVFWSNGNTNGLSVDDIELNQPLQEPASVVERDLELEIDRWMPRDSTQSYEVILNETNTTSGDVNLTDVTADANVTIYNITNTTGFSEPIATVNNSTDTIRSYNETGVVAVNATYDGNELDNATNLTVGPRNLDNIGIMPPEQWPCSFLVCDESPDGGDNPHNIGSSMQWTLFIVIVMTVGSRMFENPWAGVGGGMLTSILLWILEFVVLGVVLGTVFSGILVGIIMVRSSMGRGVGRDDEFSGTAGSRFRR